TFNLETLASGTERRQKLELAIVADTLPDVSYEASSLLRKWARLGAVVPVDEAMTKADRDDYLPALHDQARQDGKTWFWPWLGTATFVCLNRKLFELKNATRLIPQGEARQWTFEQFVEAAQAVTERPAEVYGFGVQFAAAPGGYGRSVFLWNRDPKARLFSEDGKRIALNTPAAVEGLQFLLDLERRYNVMPPNPTGLSAVDVDNLLWSRNLAMYNGAQSTIGVWRQRVRERRTEPQAVELYPVDFPAARGVEPISYIEAGGYAALKQADANRRRAALEFGRFLTNRENTAAVETITAIPARRSALDVYKDDPLMQWVARLNQDGRKVAYDALHPLYVDVRVHETAMYLQVMRQERSPKDALDEFARLAQEELRQKGYA
ncbi:MAG: extracellular solute-binding protein, partial [Chloroflexota bacterium]|nr:extracellular solute-binding protein [Chloroflexota bacterium]